MADERERYEPNYPDINVVSNELTPTGFTSRELVIKEEQAQKDIAEYPEWLLAIKANSINGKVNRGQDSKIELESLGFEILRKFDDLFYLTIPPNGWEKKTKGYWTTITDCNGNEIISQFHKGAIYDRDAFLNIIV